MKVTNWRKKIVAAIVAAGIWVPGLAQAYDIPLGDADFDDYTVDPYVPGGPPDGYAYSGLYRPTSAWVDDLDSPDPPGSGNYFEDDGDSNWLYDDAYGADGPPYRGAPRGGVNDQAMHGGFNYSAQEVGAFVGNATYTFSLWAQGDNDAVLSGSDLYMYLFDGSQDFIDGGPGQLATAHYIGMGNDFDNHGGPSMSPDESRDNWTKLSISYYVPSGSPLIGRPIGVAFYLGNDIAVDDASLTAVPEPGTMMLVGLGGLSLLGIRRKRN